MKNKYLLITSARNEENLIENTILTVVNQTIKPNKWVIVSDNSTDRTDDIIKEYENKYSFIKYLRKDESIRRDFASKVHAINLALFKISIDDYDFLGILDADITFQPNYYEQVLIELDKDPKLGIAGGEFFDIFNGKKVRVNKSSMSVRGGVQFFRTECFRQIGGFVPLEIGGEDVVSEVTARMKGWKVQSFDHIMAEHHRITGTGGWSIYKSRFYDGILSFKMGYHPLFQISKSIYHLKERPFIINGLLSFSGFLWAYISGRQRKVSKEFISFLRHEQLNRMKHIKF